MNETNIMSDMLVLADGCPIPCMPLSVMTELLSSSHAALVARGLPGVADAHHVLHFSDIVRSAAVCIRDAAAHEMKVRERESSIDGEPIMFVSSQHANVFYRSARCVLRAMGESSSDDGGSSDDMCLAAFDRESCTLRGLPDTQVPIILTGRVLSMFERGWGDGRVFPFASRIIESDGGAGDSMKYMITDPIAQGGFSDRNIPDYARFLSWVFAYHSLFGLITSLRNVYDARVGEQGVLLRPTISSWAVSERCGVDSMLWASFVAVPYDHGGDGVFFLPNMPRYEHPSAEAGDNLVPVFIVIDTLAGAVGEQYAPEVAKMYRREYSSVDRSFESCDQGHPSASSAVILGDGSGCIMNTMRGGVVRDIPPELRGKDGES